MTSEMRQVVTNSFGIKVNEKFLFKKNLVFCETLYRAKILKADDRFILVFILKGNRFFFFFLLKRRRERLEKTK